MTLVGSRRRVDVTLPAEISVAQLLPDVLDLLGESTNGVVAEWGLSRVGGRLLDPELSLADQGIEEGTMLFLHDRTAAPPAPVIEDFAEQVAVAVDAQPGRWSARMVPALLVAAGATTAVGAGVLELVAGDPRARAVFGGIGVIVITAGALAVVGALGQRRLAAVLLFSGLPLWAAAGAGVAGLGHAVALATLAAVLGAIAFGALVAVVIAGDVAMSVAAGVVAATLVPALVGAGAAVLGASLQTAAALVIPIELGALALTPPITVRLAGIAAFNVQFLEQRLASGRLLLASVLAGTAFAIAASSVALAASGQWPAWVLVAVTSIAIALRARHFRFAAEIVPLIAASLIAAVSLEYPLAAWLAFTAHGIGDFTALLIADTAILVAALIVVRRWEITASIKPWLERIEVTAIAASVPLAVGAAGAFDAAVRFARGFG